MVLKTHNNPQQSLPLVAGTVKTLRFFAGPCARRYALPDRTQAIYKDDKMTAKS